MRTLITLAYIAQVAARHPRGALAIFRHLGGVGLFILSIIDGSPLPAFAGPDILTAVLSLRRNEPWFYYTIIATIGSVAGAYITFRIARHAGVEYLHKKFGEGKVRPLMNFYQKWGTETLVVTTVLPVPFPTTAIVAIAGVVDYPVRRFLLVMAASRAVRYGAIAVIASHYGRTFVHALRHPSEYAGWLAAITAGVVAVTLGLLILSRRLQSTDAAANISAS